MKAGGQVGYRKTLNGEPKLDGGEGCYLFKADKNKPVYERGCFSCPFEDCLRPDRGSYRKTELKKLNVVQAQLL